MVTLSEYVTGANCTSLYIKTLVCVCVCVYVVCVCVFCGCVCVCGVCTEHDVHHRRTSV